MRRVAPHVAAAAAVVLAIVGGLWLWTGVVAPGYWSAIVLGVAWCVLVSVAAGRAGRRLPHVRRTLRASFFACAALLVAGFYVTSVRETTVDEVVVKGSPASSLSESERERALQGTDPLAPQP